MHGHFLLTVDPRYRYCRSTSYNLQPDKYRFIIYNIYRLNIASRQRSYHWLLPIEGQVNVIMRQVSFSNLISLRECNCMLWMNIKSHIVVNLGRSWKFYLGLSNPVRSTAKHLKPTFTAHIKAWSSILFILIFNH